MNACTNYFQKWSITYIFTHTHNGLFCFYILYLNLFSKNSRLTYPIEYIYIHLIIIFLNLDSSLEESSRSCCWCARVCVDLTSFFYYSSKIVGQYHWFSILESFRRLPPLYTPIIAICFIFL